MFTASRGTLHTLVGMWSSKMRAADKSTVMFAVEAYLTQSDSQSAQSAELSTVLQTSSIDHALGVLSSLHDGGKLTPEVCRHSIAIS